MEEKLYFVLCCVFLHTLMQLPIGGNTAEQQLNSSDVLYYPGDVVVSPSLANAQNRTPIYLPGKCSKNEILYPGDHESDWVCDCKPGFVYYPKHDACYDLYTQGFCKAGEYVDLERPSMLVKCTNNTCTEANKVPFRGECVVLGRHDSRVCPKEKRIRFIVGVNTTTLELACIEGNDWLSRIETENIMPYAGANRCHNGTKASYNGECEHRP